ncbi:MAG: hypothetical protein JW748_06875 [Anaerolineales bacterium]|nr:hypothetical protein [Anaerolineales bacterium]
MNTNRNNRFRRLIFLLPIIFASLCILGFGLSSLSNTLLPSRPAAADRLSGLDKARAAEALHLRRAFGDLLWPGWGAADIPMIFYNEGYAFLTGFPDPAAGWVKMPDFILRGGPWEAVPEDVFEGDVYFRQPLASAGETPEAFIVRIGDRWVSSLLTAEWMEINLGNELRGMLPPPLQSILPYRLAARVFLAAAGGNDLYVCAILHESFHAHQAMLAQDRLLAAETVYNHNAIRYPFDDPGFTADWRTELDLLADAVQAESDAETLDRARQFLDTREKRRAAANLDAALIDWERLKEWEEGLAKYTELGIWRLAAESSDYAPLPAMEADPGFSDYGNFKQIWSQQTTQIRLMASDDGDTRFYYSGLAQAVILDRLMPGWRTRILTEDVMLEDILQEAVNGTV